MTAWVGTAPVLLMRNQRQPKLPLLSMGTESGLWLTRTKWSSSWPQGFSSIGNDYSWVMAEGQHPDLPLSPQVVTTSTDFTRCQGCHWLSLVESGVIPSHY